MANPAAAARLSRVGVGQMNLATAAMEFIATVKGDRITPFQGDAIRALSPVSNHQTHSIVHSDLPALSFSVSYQLSDDRSVTTEPDPGPALGESRLQ